MKRRRLVLDKETISTNASDGGARWGMAAPLPSFVDCESFEPFCTVACPCSTDFLSGCDSCYGCQPDEPPPSAVFSDCGNCTVFIC